MVNGRTVRLHLFPSGVIFIHSRLSRLFATLTVVPALNKFLIVFPCDNVYELLLFSGFNLICIHLFLSFRMLFRLTV